MNGEPTPVRIQVTVEVPERFFGDLEYIQERIRCAILLAFPRRPVGEIEPDPVFPMSGTAVKKAAARKKK